MRCLDIKHKEMKITETTAVRHCKQSYLQSHVGFISTVLQHSTVPHLLPEFALMTDAIQLALNVLLGDLEQS